MTEYVRPDWCGEDTWNRAKALVFKLVPESLMARTGQRRIEIAAKALQDEAKDAWEQVDVMSNWSVVQVSGLNKSVHDYMGHWEGRAEKAEAEVKVLSGALAGMLDVWSGYQITECDAAIMAMQFIGIDRWSAQAALEADTTSDDLIEAAGITK
jgi:hypothetical protein